MSLRMDRRQFLRTIVGLVFSLAGQPGLRARKASSHIGNQKAPNILILVFDAFSARNASIYGYARETTPNLEQFADGAIVYHRNYSAGNFTNPGTASLLTGTYPWTHRALHLRDSVSRDAVRTNMFSSFAAAQYHRIAYSHNLQVTGLLDDFRPDLEELMRTRQLCLMDSQLSDLLFLKDHNVAIWRERLFRGGGTVLPSTPTSMLLYPLHKRIWLAYRGMLEGHYKDLFPRGLPTLHDQVFLLEDAIDWLIEGLDRMPRPFLAYFHLLPPHDPYNTRREFVDRFDDGWQALAKEEHFLSDRQSDEYLSEKRRLYDEYIAYADAEFGRLYRSMAHSGLLDDTYVVLTSDHGEMFERGIWGHITPTLYEPVVHVPLLIFRPGQRQREDVYVPSSGVDLLPTLLHATGQPIPDWCEGRVLPPFGEPGALSDRSAYVVEAKSNRKQGPLTKASVAMIKGRHKLVHYLGYFGYEDEYELYDLVNDTEETEDLYPSGGALVRELRDELQAKIQEINQPYL